MVATLPERLHHLADRWYVGHYLRVQEQQVVDDRRRQEFISHLKRGGRSYWLW